MSVDEASNISEMAENIHPHNSSICNMKEELINNEQRNSEEIINILQKELENCPTDINLTIRLLGCFVRNDRICEAYDHICDIEAKNLFSNNLIWYRSITDILTRYRKLEVGDLTWQFWCTFISISDKLLRLTLDERGCNVKESSQYINQLFHFDQLLYEASQNISDCPDKLLSNEFLNHYQGQLYFHFATTILKEAQKDLIEFKEAAAITLPLLFASYDLKPVNLQVSWINQLVEVQKKWLQRWHLEGAFRCSQSGHILLAAAKDKKYVVIAKATQHSFGMWQERLFKKIFVDHEQQLKMNSSFFVNNQVELDLQLPTAQELLEYDEKSLHLFPSSLQHYIWVSLNNELSELRYLPFEGLPYSAKNLSNCRAETLSVLDVEAFVYCATLCSKDHLKNSMYYNADRPKVLPESITRLLGSSEQEKFLTAAYKMYKSEQSSDLGEMRLILIRGLETVRCIGRHGIEVNLLVELADIFSRKAEKCNKKSQIEFNNARAELYWKTAVDLLEKMKSNPFVAQPSNRFFVYQTKEMPLSEIYSQIDKGKLFLGSVALKRKEYDKALNMFRESKDPFASFRQAEAYKQLADRLLCRKEESVTKEMKNQGVVLITKARDCLYLTVDRLRDPTVDKNHPLNGQLATEIDKVEELLVNLDSDRTDRNECDGVSNENTSDDGEERCNLADNTNHFLNVVTSPNNTRQDTKNIQSTPLRPNKSRIQVKPTIERLDAQLRQLYAFKDVATSQVLKQNEIMLESHRSLVNELRGFKEAVYDLSTQVGGLKNVKSGLEELRDVKKLVDELRSSVKELQSFRNVSDMVSELRKEIAEMKRDEGRRCKVDPYENEYSGFRVGSNVNYNPNLYHNNYPNGVHQVVPPPAALYPAGFYPAVYGAMASYGYPNLGLSQPGQLYGTELQPNLTAMANPSAQANSLFATHSHIPGQTVQAPLNLPSSSANPSFSAGQILPQITSQSYSFETTPTTSSTVAISSSTSTKSAPRNVVITSSDPLPTLQSALPPPVFSVTVPPQHIKGNLLRSQLHNNQKPVSTDSVRDTSVFGKPAFAESSERVESTKPVTNSVEQETGLRKDNLGRASTSSPSSDLISVLEFPSDTISPNEVTLFERPAMLFVFVNASNEFRVKGSGPFMVLEDKDKSTFRILMKNEQGDNIANNYITLDLKIASVKDKLFYWRNLDYSNGKLTCENVCLKFRNSEDADEFYAVFEQCKQKCGGINAKTSGLETKPVKNVDILTSQSGNILESFSFTTKPPFQLEEDKSVLVKPNVPLENKTQSIFANFSFTTGNNSNNTVEMNTNKNSPILLACLSSTPSKIGEPISSNTFKHADASLTEEFVPNAEFQPVIPLPDIADVKTGEENAEVLFNCRAKLLRFDSEKKEWKERGLGNMKVLREKTLVRLLMRREQIHKVCCNHQLLKNINFQYMPNNFKALTWWAQDYADEVLKAETFAVRFKTDEQASDFLTCILSAQASLNDDNSLGSKETLKKEDTSTEYPQGFGDKLKPSKGSWECKNCYVSNENNANKCVACEGPTISMVKFDPASLSNQKQCQILSESTPKVTTAWGNSFKPKAGSWECQCCLIRNEADVENCLSCEFPNNEATNKKKSPSSALEGISLKTPLAFNMGIGSGSSAVTLPPGETSNTFKFGSSTSSSAASFRLSNTTFSLRSPLSLDLSGASNATGGFPFGSPAAQAFEFKPRSQTKSTGPEDAPPSDCSYVDEEEEDNIYFKPEKIEVKTGEESEDVLYCRRAKLLKFIDGEWKERGIGDLKILRNEINGKLRVLMRRDRLLTICLNHALTPNVDYLPKDDKTWLFNAADFSEGEVSHDKFCLRFKNADIAEEFKEAVEKSLEGVKATEELNHSDGNSEVEFVMETSATAEEVKEAQRLGLPSKFFAYRQLPLCTCDQCAKDDEYFKGTVLDEYSSKEASTPTEKVSDCSVSSESAMFFTPCSFGDAPKHQTLRDLLAKPPIFKQSPTYPSSIEKPNICTDIPISSSTTTAGNLFGSKFGINANLFGVKSVAADNTAFKSFSFAAKCPGSASTSPNLSSSSSNIHVGNKGSLLSDSKTTATNLFGGSTADPKNLFGTPQMTIELFGSSAPASTPITSNTPFSEVKTGIFASPNTVTNILGCQFSTTKPMFGSNTSTTASILRPARIATSDEESTPITEANVSPFGNIDTGRLFGSTNILSLGSGAKYVFGERGSTFGQHKDEKGKEVKTVVKSATSREQPNTSEIGEDAEAILNSSDDISFSSLARKSQSIAPTFQRPSESGGDVQPFAFLGAGTPVFGSKKKQQTGTTPDISVAEEEEGNREGTADEEYDPHYEPVIPMPDAIVVSTGEEEETSLFNERAKLFRFDADSKEWKERGVGQMKILHHVENGTYRFILRREQVHKLVLNQLITPTVEVQPMATSDKACMWAGYNYIDQQMNLEKLAVRFKYRETSEKFLETVQTCLSVVKEAQNDNLPSTIENYGLENISSDSDPQDESNHPNDDNDYYGDDDPYNDEDDYEVER